MTTTRSTYRLWRQADGAGSFAEVEVSLNDEESSEPLGKEIPDEWIDAARRGIASALITMGGALPSPKLRRLVFSFADTTYDSVFAAAFLATARLFGREKSFVLRRDRGKWSVSQVDG